MTAHPSQTPPVAVGNSHAISIGWSRLWYCLALLIVVAIVFARGVPSPFIFDDTDGIIKNTSIVKLWPLIGTADHPGPLNPLAGMPTSGRPLVNLSLALNYHFGNLQPAGYHLANLIVHIASALLLFAILFRTLTLNFFHGKFLSVAAPLSFSIALLWAVHPLQTEAVVYITQRTELLMGFFYLATMYYSLRYWQAASPIARTVWLVVATVACLAGMACKEVMVTAPVMVLLYERTFLVGSFRQAWRQSWPLYVGLFLSWAFLLVLNIDAPRSESAGFHLGIPLFDWWLIQTKAVVIYLKLVVCPWPLSIHYFIPYLTLYQALPYFLITGALIVCTLILLWRHTASGYLLAWTLLILSPTLIVPIPTEAAAERRMYLSLAAMITLLIVDAYSLFRKITPSSAAQPSQTTPHRPPLAILAPVIGIAIVFGLISEHRLAAYQNKLTLWQDTVAQQPDDALAQNNLGAALAEAGRLPEALPHLQKSLELFPNYDLAQFNLAHAFLVSGRTSEAINLFQKYVLAHPQDAMAHLKLGSALTAADRTQEAIQQFNETLRLNPNYVVAYNSLGDALIAAGRPDEAIEPLQQALKREPQTAELHNNLGNALAHAGRLQDAIEQFQKAITLKPDYAQAYFNLANSQDQAGQTQQAIEHYQQALKLEPESATFHNSLGIAFVHAGRLPEAIEEFQQATKFQPDYAEAYFNLGVVQGRLGHIQEAIDKYEEALKLKPDYPNAHNNLGTALRQLGQLDEGLQHYQQALQLKSDYAEAFGNLAIAYAQLNRSAEAQSAAEKGVELARSQGNNTLAQKIDAWLADYRAQLKKSNPQLPKASPAQPTR